MSTRVMKEQSNTQSFLTPKKKTEKRSENNEKFEKKSLLNENLKIIRRQKSIGCEQFRENKINTKIQKNGLLELKNTFPDKNEPDEIKNCQNREEKKISSQRQITN